MENLNLSKFRKNILDKVEKLKKIVERSNELKLKNPELSNKEAMKLASDELKNDN
jgi:hypothetical protein